ncbi:DUF4382 domain-containing protein [Vibrio sp. PID17_43]|uniref:DUF4382 domain-containing protein n=1 Tax=Vibrio sp. PID17_43 TaxID=1583451 RepID=UPI000BFFCE36|nr:DUF4382 domain-containing protein [Vibrio sp. PID17_43]PHJ40887.1 hypothetical protein AK965_14740 [Vibrio sp. PID17_43]
MNAFKFSMIGAAVVFALTGCGSDSDSKSTTTPVTLSVSDAPIDDVSEVVVTYSKVAFLPKGEGKPQIFDVYQTNENGEYVDEEGNLLEEGEDPLPLSVNLLAFQGSDAQELVDGVTIPSGDYQLCVFVHDGDHFPYPSYVIDNSTGNAIKTPLTVKGDGACPQVVGKEPSTGVIFINNPFSVNPDNNDYVLEFDLRRGLKDATGKDEGYTIKRNSWSLINTVTTGNIKGEIALNDTYLQCESETNSGNGYAHAVYLYKGNIAQADMGTFAQSDLQAPIASANVVTDDEGLTYQYELGFVEPGTYSVGYTCTANDDSEEGIVEGEAFSIYTAKSGLSVSAGTDTDANL